LALDALPIKSSFKDYFLKVLPNKGDDGFGLGLPCVFTLLAAITSLASYKRILRARRSYCLLKCTSLAIFCEERSRAIADIEF